MSRNPHNKNKDGHDNRQIRKRKEYHASEVKYVQDPGIAATRYLCSVCLIERTRLYHSCAHDSAPMRADEFVCIELNWHEMRTLAIWAQEYIKHIPSKADRRRAIDSLNSIRLRIANQCPWMDDKAPLSL